jgi:hypothetical protein
MSDRPASEEIRDTLGAPTLLESAREAQRRSGSSSSGDGDGSGEGGGDNNQWKVKSLNPMAIGEDEGGKKKERQVVQKNGVVEDDDGIEDVRGAASFLGKKLFGERFSGRVNEKGQQQEGEGGDGEDGDNSNRQHANDDAAGDKGGKAWKEKQGQDGTDDASSKKGVRVTKTLKSSPRLTSEDIASVVKATIEATRPGAGASAASSGDAEGSVHGSEADAVLKSLSTKDKKNFEIITKMSELSESYKELPQQFIEFQKAKKQYADDYKKEHGENINWDDEEHVSWIGENQPQFDEEDFVDARIELRADAVASKRMEKLQEKLNETEKRATEGTLRERMTETAKAEISAFTEAFVPESEWDLTTAEGRKAAAEDDPVLGGIASRWAEVMEQAAEKLIRLYDGGGLWKASMSDPVDRYLATLAQNWEKALAEQDPETTVNKDGKHFATRAEFRKMTPEDQENHWIIGREEMLWILPRDISEKANIEKDDELMKLEKIAKARGWRFDKESLSTQKKRVRVNPDGIDEDGQRATRSAFSERRSEEDVTPPSSTNGSKVSTNAGSRAASNKSFSTLLVQKLFGRQSGSSE